MYIRLATIEDYNYIAHALAPKRIDYIKPSQAKEDISAARLYVIVDGKSPLLSAHLQMKLNTTTPQ